MSTDLPTGDLTDDAVLGGRLRLLQPRAGHRFGHDAILLAAATAAKSGERAVEFGAGVGAAGLALAARVPAVSVTLIDVDADLAALARENAARNALAERVSALALDVTAPAEQFTTAGLLPASIDHVLTNPPFHDAARQPGSPDARRRLAHAAPRATLKPWLRAAGHLLRPGGIVTLIFSADGLGDVLGAFGEEFGAVAVLPIYPKPAAPAIRVMVRAVKGGRAPLTVSPALVLNGGDGRPTAEAEAILRAGTALPFDRG
jgi:tRNA1(Val) A37 N6-methylase TrmN6